MSRWLATRKTTEESSDVKSGPIKSRWSFHFSLRVIRRSYEDKKNPNWLGNLSRLRRSGSFYLYSPNRSKPVHKCRILNLNLTAPPKLLLKINTGIALSGPGKLHDPGLVLSGTGLSFDINYKEVERGVGSCTLETKPHFRKTPTLSLP